MACEISSSLTRLITRELPRIVDKLAGPPFSTHCNSCCGAYTTGARDTPGYLWISESDAPLSALSSFGGLGERTIPLMWRGPVETCWNHCSLHHGAGTPRQDGTTLGRVRRPIPARICGLLMVVTCKFSVVCVREDRSHNTRGRVGYNTSQLGCGGGRRFDKDVTAFVAGQCSGALKAERVWKRLRREMSSCVAVARRPGSSGQEKKSGPKVSPSLETKELFNQGGGISRIKDVGGVFVASVSRVQRKWALGTETDLLIPSCLSSRAFVVSKSRPNLARPLVGPWLLLLPPSFRRHHEEEV
ncbi:hypothetical protein BaRGS_00032294 [Batillaria attramentaria]|uniref:Uncharacterized protein n=1 Tax=Batillaria attramentaria TaxID=370345 RepID=A0ABD0JNQ0_9CAEN